MPLRSMLISCVSAIAWTICGPGIAQTTEDDVPNASSSGTTSGFDQPGQFIVQTSYDVWIDEARNREIPVKIYLPSAGDYEPPVVLFSHGLGGNRDAATYLGEHLASWGFLCIHIQHPGSDADIWIGKRGRAVLEALNGAVKNPQTSIQRFLDIPFILDEIERRVVAGELSADTERIAIAGHSFGAHTVLASTGRVYATNRGNISFKDPRIGAGIALSPPAPGVQIDPSDYELIFGSIDVPVLHMTGTKDASPLSPGVAPEDRRLPFESITRSDQYLIVFDGGDHGVFSGRALTMNGDATPAWYADVQSDVQETALIFLLSELADNDQARSLLKEEQLVSLLRENTEVRIKRTSD